MGEMCGNIERCVFRVLSQWEYTFYFMSKRGKKMKKIKVTRIVAIIAGILAGIALIILGIDMMYLSYSPYSRTYYEQFGGDFYTSMQNTGVDIYMSVDSVGSFIDSCVQGLGGFFIVIGLIDISIFTLRLTNVLESKKHCVDKKIEILKEYKELLDNNIISQEEFEAKKSQLLD